VAPPSLEPGNETVLVVEDDRLARETVRDVLQMSGYTVLEAADGHTALRLCEQAGAPPDLLVADVVLPNMSGWSLKERVEALYPRVRTLFMSGHTDEVIEEHGVRSNEPAFIQKPFTPQTFSRKVREVLNGE
jgi:two-component system cell cycle sensor histidine kinase/response regulator CckA